jgi:hypothetical protein
MNILSKGNLTPEEILKLAQENGIKLNKEDLEAVIKGKTKTKAMAKDKLEKLKKANGGKVSKEDFLKNLAGVDMTEAELKALA